MNKIEERLLGNARKGRIEAFCSLAERKRPLLRRFLSAALPATAGGAAYDLDTLERESLVQAHAKLGELDDPEAPPFEEWLLECSRDATFALVESEVYQRSLFTSSLEVLSDIPALTPLPREAFLIDGDESPGEGPVPPDVLETLRDSRASLSPAQSQVVDLYFRERIRAPALAELLGCSENILQSFLFQVVASLGDLEALEHEEGCIPDLFLGIEVMTGLLQSEDTPSVEAARASGCEACTVLIQRTEALSRLLAHGPRVSSPVDEDFAPALMALIESRKAPHQPAPRVRPVQDLPPETTGRTSWVAPVVVVGGALLALYQFSGPGGPLGRFGSDAGEPPSPSLAAGAARDARKALPKIVGELVSPSGHRTAAFEGVEVRGGARRSSLIEYSDGASLSVAPGGVARARSDGVIVTAGTVRIDVPRERPRPFSIRAGAVEARASGSVVRATRLPGRSARLAVESGGLSVTLASGRSVVLEAGRQIDVDLVTGRYTIRDREAGGSSPGPLAPGGGGSGAGFGSGGRGGGGRGAGGVAPQKVRGFRSSF